MLINRIESRIMELALLIKNAETTEDLIKYDIELSDLKLLLELRQQKEIMVLMEEVGIK